MCTFYKSRSPKKRKKTVKLSLSFCAFRIYAKKLLIKRWGNGPQLETYWANRKFPFPFLDWVCGHNLARGFTAATALDFLTGLLAANRPRPAMVFLFCGLYDFLWTGFDEKLLDRNRENLLTSISPTVFNSGSIKKLERFTYFRSVWNGLAFWNNRSKPCWSKSGKPWLEGGSLVSCWLLLLKLPRGRFAYDHISNGSMISFVATGYNDNAGQGEKNL